MFSAANLPQASLYAGRGWFSSFEGSAVFGLKTAATGKESRHDRN